jgi:hypothetical protein
MGVPNTSVIASGGPARGAVVRSAVLEQFTRLIAGADSATRTLAAWCGEPPTTRIHTREEAATLPEEAVLLVIRPIRASETSAAPGTSPGAASIQR